MKRVVIVGATSGIGYESAKIFLEQGYIVGLAGRREENLKPLIDEYPQTTFSKQIDITSQEAPQLLSELIEEMGGMDIYLHVSGIGYQNIALDKQIEIDTVKTNCLGLTQMATQSETSVLLNQYGSMVTT